MSFLIVEWCKLVMVNYEVLLVLLVFYVFFGIEFDFWEGKCYVSLVGFMFLNIKLLGVKILFYFNFEEVNLWFYVKCFDGENYKRGVVFIKEIVLKFVFIFVVNIVYYENYEILFMEYCWEEILENR